MNNNTGNQSSKRHRCRNGFSVVETLVVAAIVAILVVIAVPNLQRIMQSLRITGDLRDLNGMVGQAKMGAAAGFTHARVRANLGANTFQLETWNKAGIGGAGCWQTVGDTANPCTVAASPVQQLSPGVTFGFDQVATPPTGTTAVIAQADPCGTLPAGTPGNPVTGGTACIEFNSRGIPYSAVTGNPDGKGALYVNNGTKVYGLTVAMTGYALNWSAADASGSTGWQHQ